MERSVANLWGLLMSAPVYIIWIAGIVIAAVRWSRHPRVSLLAISGLAILLVREVVATLLNPWLQITLVHRGIAMGRLSVIFGLVVLMGSLIRALGWGLVLAALFTKRSVEIDAV
jgi:hypothetical protein